MSNDKETFYVFDPSITNKDCELVQTLRVELLEFTTDLKGLKLPFSEYGIGLTLKDHEDNSEQFIKITKDVIPVLKEMIQRVEEKNRDE